MPIYKTTLVRTLVVIIEANSEDEAMELSEYFVVERDGSRPFDKENYKFEIKHIEMMENEALEVEPLEKGDKLSEFLA